MMDIFGLKLIRLWEREELFAVQKRCEMIILKIITNMFT